MTKTLVVTSLNNPKDLHRCILAHASNTCNENSVRLEFTKESKNKMKKTDSKKNKKIIKAIESMTTDDKHVYLRTDLKTSFPPEDIHMSIRIICQDNKYRHIDINPPYVCSVSQISEECSENSEGYPVFQFAIGLNQEWVLAEYESYSEAEKAREWLVREMIYSYKRK